MISAARTPEHSRRPGFTLLEIVVVLALAAIITGGAVGLMVYSSDERALRDASGEVEVLAKRARTKAILDQIPYALEFRQGVVRMLPYAQAGLPLRDIRHSVAAEHTFTLPEDMQLSVLRWNTGEKWLPVRGDAVYVWRFDPEGLSEPLGIRFKIHDSWAEDIYHPLTASIQSSQLEAR